MIGRDFLFLCPVVGTNHQIRMWRFSQEVTVTLPNKVMFGGGVCSQSEII